MLKKAINRRACIYTANRVFVGTILKLSNEWDDDFVTSLYGQNIVKIKEDDNSIVHIKTAYITAIEVLSDNNNIQ